jgi:hypothetical protein
MCAPSLSRIESELPASREPVEGQEKASSVQRAIRELRAREL